MTSRLSNFGPERSKNVLFRVPERCWAVQHGSKNGWCSFSAWMQLIFILQFYYNPSSFIWLSSASVIDASGKNLVRKGRSQANLSKLMHYLISSISIAYREEMKKRNNENDLRKYRKITNFFMVSFYFYLSYKASYKRNFG